MFDLTLWTTSFIIAQALGCMAFVFGTYSFLNTDDNKMLFWSIVANTIFIPHYIILGAESSAITTAIIVVRAYLAKEHKHPWMIIPFSTITIVQWVMFGDNIELLTALASLITTYAFFMCSQIKLRISLIVSGMLWIAIGLHYYAYFTILFNIFLIVACSSAIYRIKKEDLSVNFDKNSTS